MKFVYTVSGIVFKFIIVEFKDRFVIEPDFAYWAPESHLTDKSQRPDEGFSYTSDNNTEWLSNGDFNNLLEAVH